MKSFKTAFASIIACSAFAAAPALAATYTYGTGYASSYNDAYQLAVADAGDTCTLLGGTPTNYVQVTGNYYAGGYFTVSVRRFCKGV
ncbi:hypothetical protein C7S18_06415 [Ahniella affigens]|uniref:Uncharacterized protein n=1 Tax=Ahniella affigens TaxID=2021234 RepID=A0A2P1PPT5_9GAMM|nr:hypothetical protein [Ahniella affigens]AVP96856.1 hypothetical protein C7S18_06415 [Ahniella affigens]